MAFFVYTPSVSLAISFFTDTPTGRLDCRAGSFLGGLVSIVAICFFQDTPTGSSFPPDRFPLGVPCVRI